MINRPRTATLLAASILLAAAPAFAVDAYNGPNSGGLWSTAANWSPASVPVTSDDVLTGTFPASRIGVNVDLTFNSTYTGSGLNSLTLDSVNCNSITVNQSVSSTLIAATENIGKTVSGNIYNQSAGNNTVTSALNIAVSNSATGTYNLFGGNLTLNNAALNVGVNGSSGTFTLSTGSLVFNNSTLDVGSTGTASGTFNLNGGSMSGASSESVGGTATGFFFQAAGTNNITSGTLSLGGGFTSTANGTYNLSGNGTLITQAEYYGGSGATTSYGIFIQSNGTHTFGSQGLHIESGSYYLTGGTLNSSTGYLDLGEVAGKISNFGQNGGTVNISTIFLGDTSGGVGNFTLFSGSLTTGYTQVGDQNGGVGNFTQSGGTHLITGALILGVGSGTSGAYTLSGAANVTLTAPVEQLGDSGTGVFFQSGGTNSVNSLPTSQLLLGSNFGSIGQYQLTGGLLKSSETVVGDAGTGVFGINGGTQQITSLGGAPGDLLLGNATTGNGTYNMVASNVSTPTLSAVSETIGVAGLGLFFQTAGNNTATSSITLGGASSANGTYQLLGGTVTAATLNVALNGIGTFTQTGGTVTLSSTLVIGVNPSGLGLYALSSPGSLSSLNEQIGLAGAGAFTQSGGNNTVTGTLTIGNIGSGAYTLSGGNLTSSTTPGAITVNPNGFLHQTGGTLNGYLRNSGAFTFDAGAFNATFDNSLIGNATINGTLITQNVINSGNIIINAGGALTALDTGTITNSGKISLAGGALGTTTLAPIINNSTITGFGTIASNGGFTNNALITQGAGTLTFAAPGDFNNGDIELAAGRLLSLGSPLSNNATLNLNGAVISGSTLFNNAGGTISGPGLIATPLSNGGTVQANPGTLTITSTWTNFGLILLSPGATLTGGAITNSSTLQGAGTVGAPVINNGIIEALGGTLTFSSNITNPANATLIASTGNKLLLAGGLPTNAGLLSLTGGTIDNNNRPLNNTGEITGYGTLRTGGAGLTNNGTLTLTGGVTTINGNVTNAATRSIEVKFTPAIFTGVVTNNGTIKTTNTTATFAGTLVNNGSYISDPSTNIFQGAVATGAAGSMTGSTGDVFVFAGGSFSNAGVFTNGGTIQSSEPISNSGAFTQTGPQTWSSTGTFTNTAGHATFGSNAKLGNLTITGGIVDLTTSKFVIEPANKIATLVALQANANSGALTASGLTANLALALIDNGSLITPFTIFGGLPADSGSILIAPELLGDANIDGRVDLNDLNTVLNHLGSPNAGWTWGGFDGQATIDLNDLNAVLNHLGTTYANSSSAISAESLTPVATPEPTSLALLAAAPLLLTRRKRA